MFIGAHPDDPDFYCGGAAIKLVKAGHVVKFLSVANGDCGHHIMTGEETAARRRIESNNVAKTLGLLEYEVMPIHDCCVENTLANREAILRSIRRFAPDLVVTHRSCDYHADHRATAQMVADTAYLLKVPHYCQDTPPPKNDPVYAFCYDSFTDPRPIRPDAVVTFDDCLDEKRKILNCHLSQFYEWLPWADQGGLEMDYNTMTEEERNAQLGVWLKRFENAANYARQRLIEVYGQERGAKLKYTEIFEQSPYSKVLPVDEFQALFEA